MDVCVPHYSGHSWLTQTNVDMKFFGQRQVLEQDKGVLQAKVADLQQKLERAHEVAETGEMRRLKQNMAALEEAKRQSSVKLEVVSERNQELEIERRRKNLECEELHTNYAAILRDFGALQTKYKNLMRKRTEEQYSEVTKLMGLQQQLDLETSKSRNMEVERIESNGLVQAAPTTSNQLMSQQAGRQQESGLDGVPTRGPVPMAPMPVVAQPPVAGAAAGTTLVLPENTSGLILQDASTVLPGVVVSGVEQVDHPTPTMSAQSSDLEAPEKAMSKDTVSRASVDAFQDHVGTPLFEGAHEQSAPTSLTATLTGTQVTAANSPSTLEVLDLPKQSTSTRTVPAQKGQQRPSRSSASTAPTPTAVLGGAVRQQQSSSSTASHVVAGTNQNFRGALSGTLEVRILAASNLRNADAKMGNLSDPYARVTVPVSPSGKERSVPENQRTAAFVSTKSQQTGNIPETLFPIWRDHGGKFAFQFPVDWPALSLPGPEAAETLQKTANFLQIEVYDADMIGSDFLGKATLPMPRSAAAFPGDGFTTRILAALGDPEGKAKGKGRSSVQPESSCDLGGGRLNVCNAMLSTCCDKIFSQTVPAKC